MHLTGLDTNACPLGNSKFILLSDKLNICLWLSACQVEKINHINSSWLTICQQLSQLEATFWPTMHPFLQVLFVSFMLVGVNFFFKNGICYIWSMKLIIRKLVYHDEIIIWKCTLLTIWYQIWFSSAWSASHNVIGALDNVNISCGNNDKLTVNDHTNLKCKY